jgi:hypothetical protein
MYNSFHLEISFIFYIKGFLTKKAKDQQESAASTEQKLRHFSKATTS